MLIGKEKYSGSEKIKTQSGFSFPQADHFDGFDAPVKRWLVHCRLHSMLSGFHFSVFAPWLNAIQVVKKQKSTK